ncbi:uncharacterized protein LOC111343013 [Stylophora pistillata]|uniref:uncharacterized protein LOC111343013 n=1 Tax=Stylophora pistillata TaxID=50429 RepID=UPI000C03D788|nr:uncharacterized protein LOC111343013 [Stylophora pistillata]
MALALALINISHLSLVPAIAKNKKEVSGLSALRTGFTFVIGVIIYLVTWAILGQDNRDRLSPENSMAFTVATVILVGVALVFGLIFHIVTVEPSGNSEPTGKLAASVVERMRKNSFVPSDGALPSMMCEVVDKARDQKRKERMCDLFVDALKTKGEVITVQAADNVERKRSMDMFPMRFLTALFSNKEGKHKTQTPPSDDIVLTEKPSAKCKGRELFITPEEEVCENVSKLPQERKISLIMSILDKLTGDGNENNKRLPNLPKEIEHIAVNFDSDSPKNCEEISCSSNNNEDGSTSYEAHVQQLSFQNCKEKRKTSAPTADIK